MFSFCLCPETQVFGTGLVPGSLLKSHFSDDGGGGRSGCPPRTRAAYVDLPTSCPGPLHHRLQREMRQKQVCSSQITSISSASGILFLNSHSCNSYPRARIIGHGAHRMLIVKVRLRRYPMRISDDLPPNQDSYATAQNAGDDASKPLTEYAFQC